MGGDKFIDDFSVSFDNVDSYIKIPSTTFDVDGSTHSFAFWCKRHATNSWDVVLGIEPSASNNFIIFSNSADTITIEGSEGDMAKGNIENVAGVWYHFVVVCDSGTVQVYQDGKAVTMTDSAIGSDVTINCIGGSSSSLGFNGPITDVAIYNSALTASQVKTLYNGREPYNHKEGIASSNLTHWYRMGDGTLDATNAYEGGVVSDDSQNSYLGPDLVDDVMNASNWVAWTNNTVELESGAIKITYVDDASGAYFYLRDSKGLTTDLTIGKTYKVSYKVKVNTGSVTTSLSEEGGFGVGGGATTSTTYEDKVIYTNCSSTTDHYFYAGSMGSGEIVYYKDIKVQEVSGNAGVIVNIDNNRFIGDAP
tara:strand:+ start:231 stop:1325 length:1095 start_codon:yes stop_codon:yes gene_type:complete